jgi:hypothetical protein
MSKPLLTSDACVDCGYSQGQHGRRGFGACREGRISEARRAVDLNPPPECGCKRFKQLRYPLYKPTVAEPEDSTT